MILVLGAVAVWLSNWQFDSWEAKRAAEAADWSMLDPVPVDDALGPDDPYPTDRTGHPVLVAGTWLPESTFYVSDRPLDDETGYWAVTPVRMPASDAALFVVRGWLPDLQDPPPPPTGETELTAWLQPGEGTGVADDDPDDDVLPQLRIASAMGFVDSDVYGGYVVVADEAAEGAPVGADATNPGTDGLQQARPEQLPQSSRFTAARNFLYGIQWLIFGGFAIYIWWRFCRDEIELQRAAREATAEQESADERVPSEP